MGFKKRYIHSEVNANRKHQSLLSGKYGYLYSENSEIKIIMKGGKNG